MPVAVRGWRMGFPVDEHAEYRPLSTLAKLLAGVFGFALALDLLLAALTGRVLARLGTHPSVLNGFTPADVASLVRIVHAGSTISFIWWFRRAYGNLPALGHARHHGVGWSIGAWFVPILNLFRPKQIAIELWAAGDPPAPPPDPPGLVGWWWGIFLFRVWMDARASTPARPQTLGEFQTSLLLGVASCLVSAAAAAVAIALVVRVSNRQDARAATFSHDCSPSQASR
ncbi:MAG: DUF4328 domain-containing protein [Nitriliruptorales bacterium]|nr:DUF4328 domain-containing protein [Nitriliruptorales bacterium]